MNEPINAYRIFIKYGYKFLDNDLLVTHRELTERDKLEVELCGWVFSAGCFDDPDGYFRPYGCRIIDSRDINV